MSTPNETKTPSVEASVKPIESAPVVAGVKMLQCTCTLKLDKLGSDVTLRNVTPAEMLVLAAEHHTNAGGDPILTISDVKEITRPVAAELSRLRSKYAAAKIAKVFVGAIPTLPATFDEARKAGTGIRTPRLTIDGKAQ